MESNDDPIGTITLYPFDDDVYFTHGNTEEKVSIHSRLLPTWIAAYIEGFDEFEKLVSNKEHYTVSMKMEYRVDVKVNATSFEEAFEKATEEVDNIDLSEYVLVASEPVNAERADGTLAEYNFHPYAD